MPTVDVMKNFTSLPRQPHPEIVRYLTPADQQIIRSFEDSAFAPPPPEPTPAAEPADVDAIVQAITDRVLAELQK